MERPMDKRATKVISKLVNTAPLAQAELLGLQGEVNVQGEDQKKLDVITNDVLKKALKYTGKLGTMASEEEDEPVSASLEGLGSVLADTGKY
ncbi:FBP, partial [Symbiodinium microadriaticum]